VEAATTILVAYLYDININNIIYNQIYAYKHPQHALVPCPEQDEEAAPKSVASDILVKLALPM